MANGFLTASPSARHGDTTVHVAAGYVIAQKFTCGVSGTQEISEIGCYIYDTIAGQDFRMAIFTDDSVNSCPEAMVSNSETSTITTSNQTTPTKESYTYTTKPQLTGGTDYWIVSFYNGDNLYVDCFSTTGTNAVYLINETAYTWPTGVDWHTASSGSTYDVGCYAVYAAAAWVGEINGITNPAKVNGIAVANIESINGI